MKKNHIYYSFGLAFLLILGFSSVDVLAQEDIEIVNEEESEISEVPDVPEQPENPENPEVPDVPEIPEEPELHEPGMAEKDGNTVIYGEDGKLLTGVQIYLGNAYYLDPVTGAMAHGFVSAPGGNAYYCDDFGHIQTGEFKVDHVTVTTDKTGKILYSVQDNVTYFNQKDSRWANSTVGSYGNIANTGCAMNVLCSIINQIKGTNYTPVTMGKIVNQAGYYNKTCAGTKAEAFEYVCQYFGLEYEMLPTVELAQSALKKGSFIAAGVGPEEGCIFVKAGYCHEILLFGYNQDGTTNVYDPLHSNLNGMYEIDFIYSIPAYGYLSQIDGCTFFGLRLNSSVASNNLSSSKVQAHVGNQTYVGAPVNPDVVIVINDKTLVEGRDYISLGSFNNIEVGKAYKLIQGINNFTGQLKVDFDIIGTIIQDGKYQIVAGANSTLVVHNSYGSTTPGTEYVIYTNANKDRQQFEIKRLANGYYVIKNLASNLYLTCGDMCDIEQTTPLTQDYFSYEKDMLWMIEEINGRLVFSSAWDRNYVLDINCEKLGSDKELILGKRNEEAPYQQWVLKAI
ncbi:MAG: RICIN domain-containing protein [Firmicutes bacterium]|nr:RICIN domain-containing protein [Bacillota bacterium]